MFSSILRFLKGTQINSLSLTGSKLNGPYFAYPYPISCFPVLTCSKLNGSYFAYPYSISKQEKCYHHLFKSASHKPKEISLIKYKE